MKRILLIEDRVERQSKFTDDTGIDLEQYCSFLDNRTTLDKSSLSAYETIITHRSAFGNDDENLLDYLKKHCEETGTSLVFFSGGISSTYYSKGKYEFLLLNSKSFYSQNLQLFLDDVKEGKDANVLLLGYGKQWKFNILLNTLEKINLFISNSQRECKVKIKLSRFKTSTKIENINGMIDFEYPEIEGGGISLDNLKLFEKQIKEEIQKKVEINV
jgi:hypothetical protein